MRRARLLLWVTVLIALVVGYGIGYRARISEEEVIYHPYKMLPAVPDDLAYGGILLP